MKKTDLVIFGLLALLIVGCSQQPKQENVNHDVAMTQVLVEDGVYDDEKSYNQLVIASSGVTLENATVKTLIIDEGVERGSITLRNVQIEQFEVYSGYEEEIILDNATVDKMISGQSELSSRVIVNETSTIKEVNIVKPSTLTLHSQVEDIWMDAPDSQITLGEKAVVQNMICTASSQNSKVTMEGQIDRLAVDSNVQFSGNGFITTVHTTAEDNFSNIQVKSKKQEVLATLPDYNGSSNNDSKDNSLSDMLDGNQKPNATEKPDHSDSQNNGNSNQEEQPQIPSTGDKEQETEKENTPPRKIVLQVQQAENGDLILASDQESFIDSIQEVTLTLPEQSYERRFGSDTMVKSGKNLTISASTLQLQGINDGYYLVKAIGSQTIGTDVTLKNLVNVVFTMEVFQDQYGNLRLIPDKKDVLQKLQSVHLISTNQDVVWTASDFIYNGDRNLAVLRLEKLLEQRLVAGVNYTVMIEATGYVPLTTGVTLTKGYIPQICVAQTQVTEEGVLFSMMNEESLNQLKYVILNGTVHEAQNVGKFDVIQNSYLLYADSFVSLAPELQIGLTGQDSSLILYHEKIHWEVKTPQESENQGQAQDVVSPEQADETNITNITETEGISSGCGQTNP